MAVVQITAPLEQLKPINLYNGMADVANLLNSVRFTVCVDRIGNLLHHRCLTAIAQAWLESIESKHEGFKAENLSQAKGRLFRVASALQ